MASPGVFAFEAIDDVTLPLMPLSVRRVLDALGRHLSLSGWQSLSLDERRALVQAGTFDDIDRSVEVVVDRAVPPATLAMRIQEGGTAGAGAPAALVDVLGANRPLDAASWRSLSGLARYALLKYVAKPEKLGAAYDEIIGSPPMASRVASGVPARLTHVNDAGEARMVDVGAKRETARRAVASALLRTTPRAIEAIAAGAVEKGDVLAAARIAGILASKRTPELVPLCHPVRTTRAEIAFDLDAQRGELAVRATVEAVDRTGVEMEAMVAATVAALTAYDMLKAIDRWATIERVGLEEKSGGKSGDVRRPRPGGGP
jgi:cyclic pyranopterin phosphate synthase